MKEATGELNMTVVTVVAIAAVAAFFYAFVWPGIKRSIESSTYCAMASCDSNTCTTNGARTTCTTCTAPNARDDGTDWTGTCSFENGAADAPQT